jgi:hypothetical protein
MVGIFIECFMQVFEGRSFGWDFVAGQGKAAKG